MPLSGTQKTLSTRGTDTITMVTASELNFPVAVDQEVSEDAAVAAVVVVEPGKEEVAEDVVLPPEGRNIESWCQVSNFYLPGNHPLN